MKAPTTQMISRRPKKTWLHQSECDVTWCTCRLCVVINYHCWNGLKHRWIKSWSELSREAKKFWLHVSECDVTCCTRRPSLSSHKNPESSVSHQQSCSLFSLKRCQKIKLAHKVHLKVAQSANDMMQICWLQIIWESAIGMQEDRLPAMVDQGGNQNKTLSCLDLHCNWDYQLRLSDACLLSTYKLRIRQHCIFLSPIGMQLDIYTTGGYLSDWLLAKVPLEDNWRF